MVNVNLGARSTAVRLLALLVLVPFLLVVAVAALVGIFVSSRQAYARQLAALLVKLFDKVLDESADDDG
jgi:type III secretory pathway component EscS